MCSLWNHMPLPHMRRDRPKYSSTATQEEKQQQQQNTLVKSICSVQQDKISFHKRQILCRKCTYYYNSLCTWLLNASYELIVAGGSCCSIIPSIPLIAIHINIELVTAWILSQSAFSKTGTDINKHFSGLEVADVLCENPVFLWCALSEITHPCLICTEATQGTRPLQ